MKNNFFLISFYIFLSFFINIKIISSDEIFTFNVTELQMVQDGNIFKGIDGGEVSTSNGISIKANNFEYNKMKKLLLARINVKLDDPDKKISINADKISYFKNEEKIIAEGNVKINDTLNNILISANKILYFVNEQEIKAFEKVKVKDNSNNLYIEAEKFFYFKDDKKIIAEENVKMLDLNKDVNITSNKISYEGNKEIIFSKGPTEVNIKSKYKFVSKDLTFLKNEMRLISSNQSIITSKNFSLFELGTFDYQIDNEYLKGTNITYKENSNLPDEENDKYFFKSGFFDLKNDEFTTGSAKVLLRKKIFDRSENDPRLYGVSSSYKNGITTINKAVFTSCKKRENCTPWKLEASEIKHNKNTKQLIYENSVLKVYDIPIFYFPKFFHPDPTVKRQSGFLLPKLNNSNILGSSINVPYFHVISENKDLTINPVLFSKDIKMFQNEYRQQNKNSFFIADFGITNGFKSSQANKKKNINHFFSKFTKKIETTKFISSDIEVFIEKVSKDTYLKLFANNLSENKVRPKNDDVLNSGVSLFIKDNNFILSGGADIYEDLTKIHSDRYQFVFPHYSFSRNPINFNKGIFNFNSIGNSTLDNTNNHKTRVINDFNFKMNDKIFEKIGLRNNLSFYFKNLNSVGKNVENYKNSPQVEIQSMIELSSELPLKKITRNNNQTLIPRLSFRFNPGDMKNHSGSERKINSDNIFQINRLGIDDSLESGSSITAGIDLKSEDKKNNDKFVQLKLASVFRDKEEENIPTQTSLNKKNSNIFGSVDYSFSKYLNIDYNFAVDDKINTFKYNSVGLDLSINNFVTKFNFIEEDSELGNTNVFENITKYNINNQNAVTFKTRRNRELDLTEYYNLVYEYKNDCLTAGIRFNKTYYEDRDLKPSQNLMFTISFYPLTTIEQSIE